MTQTKVSRAILAAIQGKIAAMPEAQARVARIFVDRPETAIRLPLSELAQQAGSGEASVVRFCRAVGFSNLRDLRVALAADIAYRDSGDSDPRAAEVERYCAALRDTDQRLDRELLRNVAAAMRSAPHIDIFGSGVSGMAAHLFAYSFSRIGLVSRAWSDEVAADENLSSRKTGAVAMVVSETGLTHRVEKFLRQSCAAGAYTVAVCGHDPQELHDLCDAVLVATPLFPLPERGEMGPLVAKLFICDALVNELLRERMIHESREAK